MNVLSLFDGISCGQVALERANIAYNVYYSSEIDKSAIAVTQKNYPNTIQLGNITQITKNNVPTIDILLGGSPCQGFSFNGKQLNFNDPRSKLFYEYVRLLNEVKPKYFLLENVRMKKEYQNIISKELGCEPVMIDSALVSAQSRRRLYWTNIPNIKQPEDKGLYFRDIIDTNVCNYKFYKDFQMQKFLSRTYKYQSVYNVEHPDKKVRCILGIGGSTRPKTWYESKLRYLTPLELERCQTLPENYTDGFTETKRQSMIGNAWTVDVIVHILKNMTYKAPV